MTGSSATRKSSVAAFESEQPDKEVAQTAVRTALATDPRLVPRAEKTGRLAYAATGRAPRRNKVQAIDYMVGLLQMEFSEG